MFTSYWSTEVCSSDLLYDDRADEYGRDEVGNEDHQGDNQLAACGHALSSPCRPCCTMAEPMSMNTTKLDRKITREMNSLPPSDMHSAARAGPEVRCPSQ